MKTSGERCVALTLMRCESYSGVFMSDAVNSRGSSDERMVRSVFDVLRSSTSERCRSFVEEWAGQMAPSVPLISAPMCSSGM